MLKQFFAPIFDINYSCVEDKLVNSILHANQFGKNLVGDIDTIIHQKWREQFQFDFGFVPVHEQKMPERLAVNTYTDIPLLN